MTINIKSIISCLFCFIGSYIFYFEYQKLNEKNYSLFEKNEIQTKAETNNKLETSDTNNIKSKVNGQKGKDEIKLNKIEIIISKGDTFLSILRKFDIPEKQAFRIIKIIGEYYNLNKLKINDKIFFYQNYKNQTRKIEIETELDSILRINIDNKITIERNKFTKKLFKESYEFKISESLYSDGIKNNLPPDILIKLIKLFSFDLDFQRDIKIDTVVSVSFEYNEIKENKKIEYKDINYALISIDGKKFEYFKFITDDGFTDYFNKKGKNVKKSILKTPLDGARLSSSYGMRKHPISGFNKMHKGVDFAAPIGTPIYAGGNGTIEYLGNNGGYGKYIRIRHNNEYKTAYAHLSSYKKGLSKGKRVNQGDVIGYVGSTGNSTGPHLHYEILFQNKHINPLKLKLPSGKILKGDELTRFIKEYKIIYAEHLNLLYE